MGRVEVNLARRDGLGFASAGSWLASYSGESPFGGGFYGVLERVQRVGVHMGGPVLGSHAGTLRFLGGEKVFLGSYPRTSQLSVGLSQTSPS